MGELGGTSSRGQKGRRCKLRSTPEKHTYVAWLMVYFTCLLYTVFHFLMFSFFKFHWYRAFFKAIGNAWKVLVPD